MVQKLDNQINCPKCFKNDFWVTKDKRLKCKNCRYIFTLKKNVFNIKNEILEQIIIEFLLDHSTNIILGKVDISKYKLLQILTYLRKIMIKDIPDNFRKSIKIDNEYFKLNSKINKKNRSPIIGVICKGNKVYAKVLSNIKPKELKDFIKQRKKGEIINHIPLWQKNMALVFRNKFYKLFPAENKNYQKDALEAFQRYLKIKLVNKGGVRKEKLFLYLGEYVWKYNHRKLSLEEQKNILIDKIALKK